MSVVFLVFQYEGMKRTLEWNMLIKDIVSEYKSCALRWCFGGG